MNTIKHALAVLTTSALIAVGGPALASHGGNAGRALRTGTCSDGSTWKLKVKADDNQFEVEAEVDSDHAGQAWGWRIKDVGSVAASGSATTGGRSGSFS